MQVIPFVADSAAAAFAQIQAQMGPDAIVLNVRQLPAQGLARLWQKKRIEVLACAPAAPAAPKADALADLRQELADLKQQLAPQRELVPAAGAVDWSETLPDAASGRWRSAKILEATGLLPVHAQQVVERLQNLHGDTSPGSLGEELRLAREVLRQSWRAPAALDPGRPQVFIGAPGVGKTTLLCKWLTQAVLLGGRSACVWRLDGRTANTAESLSVHCEVLGVPMVHGSAQVPRSDGSDLVFVDLPGVDWREASAVQDLSRRLAEISGAQVYLVLNAAYETSVQLSQVRVLGEAPLAGLAVTHLDEETRGGKLWNLVLGTNYGLRFLSAGQNIPGEFSEATAEKVLACQFADK